MLRTERGRAACFLAFAVAGLVAAPDIAWSGGRDEDLFIRPEDQNTVLFASLDGGRSMFFSAGAKASLTGPLDRPGFVALESGGFGITRERTGGPGSLPVLRFATQAASLVGYQWTLPNVYVAALIGPEFDHEQVTVAGQIARVSEPRFGARGQVEIWSNPTRDTMLTETLVAGSSRNSIYSRSSAGYRLGNNLFAGPEVTVYATETYREVRWGAHLTDIAVGIVHLRASAGWMTTDDHHPGSPYIGLTGWIRM